MTHPKAGPKPPRRHVATRFTSYHVSSTESFPAAKRAAEGAAVELTTYAANATAQQVAATVTPDRSRQRALAADAAPLFHAGAGSTGSVVYAQMGGATADAASVMVVTRQVFTKSGISTTQTRVLDVWLTKVAGQWVFDHLDSAGGTPVPRPRSLSPEAVAVLDNPRIWMPDTARWDIYRGVISPTLLRLMSAIAERHTYAITVLETGHPVDVFGTSHQSMHTAGRAMDINLVDGQHVIDEHQPSSPADQLVHWLMLQPSVGQVGSPWDLDGSAPRSFTNAVHLDHVHVSV